ncbi:MAG: nuclear transport factor 2 family protein [Candidatus Heimdallarchaeota archaeon]|nr:nuclear transport factor 2 family protein [Candidatus Heimdallarchaeota archaeon]
MFNGENEEIEEIEKTIQLYDEAFNEWNIEKLTKAFHYDSMVYWYIPEQDRFYKGPCYRWIIGFIENQKENPEVNYYLNIESVYQFGSVAYSRLRCLIDDPEDPRDTTDYLTLMKFGDEWQVVNKSGHTIPLTAEELLERVMNDSEIPFNDPNEVKSIEQLLETYATAFHDWNLDCIKESFHPAMRLNSVDKETAEFKNHFRPYAVWNEVLQEHKAEGVRFETEVKHIDQRGTAAVAVMYWKAHTPEGIGHTTDFLTLLKVDGKWTIVNKSCNFEFEKKI